MHPSLHRLLAGVAATTLIATAAVAAGSPWDPDQVRLQRRELASGVWAVLPDDAYERDHVGTTAGFVVGDDGVLVVESMVNGRLAAQLIGEVRQVTQRPIRYLVNTSYHGDHSYGSFVFPRSTAVVQHPATEHFIREHFEADREFMIGLMGEGKGIEKAVPRPGDLIVHGFLEVDLGDRRVEVRHFGFAQTEGDLVVWVPEGKVAWVGNMVQAPPPALPWLLEGRHLEAAATLRKLRDFLPDDATVVPGHGRPMSPQEIDYSVGYLERLDEEVREAVAAGLSLEETVERVVLPEYQGYSLYPFAHRQVNVPAVYRQLEAGGGPDS